MPGHSLRPWAPQVRSCYELLNPRYSQVTLPPSPPRCKPGTDIRNMQREGRHARHADRSCGWWAEVGVCPSRAPLQTGLEKVGGKAK